MEKDVLIAIPSYKRANVQKTFELFKALKIVEKFDVLVFAYEYDPMINDYMKNVGPNLYIIPKEKIEKPNLRAKRNLIFDYAVANNYDYVFQIDDDIEFVGRHYDIEGFAKDSIAYFNMYPTLAMTSPAMSALRCVNHPMVELDVICHCTAMYNMRKLKNLRFPLDVKCEDNWISIELLRTGYSTARLNEFVIYNNDAKRDGLDNTGLSYMYEETGLNITDDLIKRFPDLVKAGVLKVKEDGNVTIVKKALAEWRANL